MAGTLLEIAEDMMTDVVDHEGALIDGAPWKEFGHEPSPGAPIPKGRG